METVYLAVGSNLGDRQSIIDQAVKSLSQTPGITLEKVSTLIETDPVGGPVQGKFLNGAIQLLTSLTPRELLQRCHEIESKLGRRKRVRNGPREIDLDILLFGERTVCEKDLVIPHPRMHERAFVLIPLQEILPQKEMSRVISSV